MSSQPPIEGRRRFRRVASLIMLALFLQGLTSVFLHLDVHDHYVCVEHARVTHDADHAREAKRSSTVDVAVHGSESERNERDPAPDERSPEESQCKWMTWLQDGTPLVPRGSPGDIEPPAIGPELGTSSLTTQIRQGRPVPVIQYAPNNSPPRG